MSLKPKLEAMTDDELLAESRYLYSTLDTVHTNPAVGRAASISTWERINDIEELLYQRHPELQYDDEE